MNEISTVRLFVLRATYLLVAVGLGLTIWPLLIQSATTPPEHYKGVVRAILGAVSLLALLGIRYPVKMLPLLLFELAWKTIWVVVIGYPLWRSGQMDADTHETWFACWMGVVIFPIAIPWAYVWRHYLRAPGERWQILSTSTSVQ
jgi:hypothetical protein